MTNEAAITTLLQGESPEVCKKIREAYEIGLIEGRDRALCPPAQWRNLPYRVLDLGLPSRTKWVRLTNQDSVSALTRSKALEMGLTLPTRAQCEELSHCAFTFDQYDGAHHQHIKGPNGREFGLYYGWTDDIKFYLWPSDGRVDDASLTAEGYVHAGQYPGRLERTTIPLSESGFSLFVLTKEMEEALKQS